MSNILVAYFSRRGMNYVGGKIVDLPAGNTEIAAEVVAELSGGELFRIVPAREYAKDYAACVRESRAELSVNARPPLASRAERMEDCDTVLLGYPNWCGTMPMPVWTFLESYDFSGRTILPFCTNEGSGMGRSEADIRGLCPSAKVGPGLSIRGPGAREARDEIAAWLKNLPGRA